jgi:16S rRNA (adenine1518-N6/adenine1519-N6)-dimethyltransferase
MPARTRRQRLGQHFLRPGAVARLVEVIAPRPGEVFLEVGTGRGALTLPLLARGARVVGVELDAALAESLRARAPGGATILTGDALHLDLRGLVPRGARVAGNLPYSVASPLLRRLLDLHDHVRDLHVMLQAEVAERVAAAPGSKAYGVLSVLFGLRADLDIPLRFPPGDFSPPPRVRSALLRARFLARPRAPVADSGRFEALVLASFRSRRKTLENNLQDSYPNLKQHLKLLNLEGRRRAETLSVGDFARLSESLGAGRGT